MRDQQIINLFFARSDKAIYHLADKYEKSMYAISYNILQNRQDAEECVNDSYLNLWNAIPPARPDPLYSFVCRVTRNISLTRYKYNNAAKRYSTNQVAFEEIADCIPSESDVTDEMEKEEITRILNGWLDTLNKDNLYIFMRRYWYMDTVSVISQNLQISQAAVYLRIDRMKKSLYKHLLEGGIII